MKIINGNEKHSITLQRAMSHYVLKEFSKTMEISKRADPIGTLNNIILETNQTMRSPFGRIESIIHNIEKGTHQCDVYAIKELQILVKILEDEDYFNRSIRLNEQLETNWNKAKDTVDSFLSKIKTFGMNTNVGITSGDISRCKSANGIMYIRNTLKSCIRTLKECWQIVWFQFLDVKEMINQIGKKKTIMIRLLNSNHLGKQNTDITLSKVNPIGNSKFLTMGVNEQGSVRLWHKEKGTLRKSQPKTYPVNWYEVEEISMPTPISWFITIKGRNQVKRKTGKLSLDNLTITSAY